MTHKYYFHLPTIFALLILSAHPSYAQGNVEVNANVSDDKPPTISITHPVDGSNWYGFLTITTTVSDDVGVTKVEFYIDDFLKITDASEPFEYLWDSGTTNLGGHAIKAIAYDAAGNSDFDTVTVNIIAVPSEDISKDGQDRDKPINFLIHIPFPITGFVQTPIDFVKANTSFFFGFLFALEMLILFWIIKKLREEAKKGRVKPPPPTSNQMP